MLHESSEQLLQMARQDHSLLQPVYREIAERFGMEVAIEIYELFRGQQICFPVRLYDSEDIHSRIVQEYDGTNLRRLAARYGYSEKTVRRIIKSKE